MSAVLRISKRKQKELRNKFNKIFKVQEFANFSKEMQKRKLKIPFNKTKTKKWLRKANNRNNKFYKITAKKVNKEHKGNIFGESN